MSDSASKNGQAKRGVLLIIFLILSLLSSLWSFLWAAINMNDYFGLSESLRELIPNFAVIGSVAIAAGFVGIVSIVGLWMWKRWGFYGFFLVAILNIVAAYLMENGFSAAMAGPVIWIAILIFLLRGKMQYLS